MFIIILLSISEKTIFADSPKVIRENILDHEYFPDSDSILLVNDEEIKDISLQDINITDIHNIKEVSVFSNGKTLNSTISLLGNPGIQQSTKELRYEMLIDFQSVYETDLPRNDYIVSIIWQNHTWVKQLAEILNSKSIRNLTQEGNSIIIESNENYSDFYDKENNAITLSLDLSKINFPANYNLIFRTAIIYENGSKIYKIADYTQPLKIPSTNIISLFKYSPNDTSSSNFFPLQEIKDAVSDLINLTNRDISFGGDRSIDITSINYFSDGNKLNAILWTMFPFKSIISHKEKDYGMFIDADFNENTGFGGIDYKFEITWNNETKTWMKTLEKWSSHGSRLVLENELISITDFTKVGERYILLSLNLDTILSPKKYKILFYSGIRNEDLHYITDYSRWVAAPHPEINIQPSESFIMIRPGETKTISLNITSTPGFTPYLEFPSLQDRSLLVDIKPSSLNVPSTGKATVLLDIVALEKTKNASSKRYSLPLQVNGDFLFTSINKSQLEPRDYFVPSAIVAEKIKETFFLYIEIQEPYTVNDYINKLRKEIGVLWKDNKDIVILIIGIFLTPFGAWAFDKIIKREKKKRAKSQIEQGR